MHRGDILEFTTITARTMTALVLSDPTIAAGVGYAFIAPVLAEPRSREHVSAPLSAVNGHAILWRTQSVPLPSLEDRPPLGQATPAEMTEIDRVLSALLGLPEPRPW